MEDVTCLRFFKQNFANNTNNYYKKYSYCHRNGIYNPRRSDDKILKLQSTRRIGYKCKAKINVKI